MPCDGPNGIFALLCCRRIGENGNARATLRVEIGGREYPDAAAPVIGSICRAELGLLPRQSLPRDPSRQACWLLHVEHISHA